MPLKPYHKLPSIRSRTAMLVLACLLPAAIGFGAVTYEAFLIQRRDLQADANRTVQALAQALDAELTQADTVALTLAASPSLAARDLPAFERQVRTLLTPSFPIAAFALTDAAGQPLLDTRPPGSGAVHPQTTALAASTGGPAHSPLFRDAAGRQWIAIAVATPAPAPSSVLVALIDPAQLAALTERQPLGPGWSMGLLDSTGHFADRRPGHARWIGTAARPDVIAASARADHGVVDLISLEGTPVFTTFQRLPGHRGWTAATAVPQASVRELLAGSMRAVSVTIAIALGTGLLFAWILGGQIARSVRALTGPARALGRGTPVELPPVQVREAAQIAHLMQEVEQELRGYRTQLEDLAARRGAELARSNAYLATVFGGAPFGLCVLDVQLRFVMVNDFMATFSGAPPAEHIGRRPSEMLDGVGHEYEQHCRAVLATGMAQVDVEISGFLPALSPDLRHMKASCFPVFGPEGQVEGVAVMVRDVTVERLQAQRIRDNEEQFRALYERSGDAHVLVTRGAGFVGGNQAAAVMYGCASVAELMGTSPMALSPRHQPDGQLSDEVIQHHMQRALNEGTTRYEWRHCRVDGTEFDADIRLTSVNIGGSGVMLATVRDITERKQAEAALRATSFQLEQSERLVRMNEARLQTLNAQLMSALEQAHAASDAKSRFVANMSHEIRTPMNAVLGLARLLEEAQLDRRERAYVARIKRSTQSLLALLNDILDFSRLDAGELRLEHARFRLCEVLATVSAMLSVAAWDKGVEPVFDVAPDVPLELEGDAMRLQQILLNLVGNAIKFTEHGQVRLAVTLSERDAGTAGLLFAVRDTGIGIAPAQQAAMFDAFSQADTSSNRRFGGAGLGLAISRRLAELMGGQLDVTSELGRGSEFRFGVRFALPPGSGSPQLPPDAQGAGLSVLVVDDNADAARVIANACRAFGWQAEILQGGLPALERLRAGPPPDLLFLDSAMPDLDGLSLLAHAQQDGIAIPPTAVLVPEHERERLLELADGLPMRAVLGKPVTPEALAEAIVTMRTGRAAPVAPPSAAPLAGRLQDIRVLLVEDNEINQEVAGYILRHAGARVEVAPNGLVAVELLRERPRRCDVVLMDIQMPVMNGHEAARAIRNQGLDDLPIVAMTANVMEEDVKAAHAAGMAHLVAKPIDVDILVDTVIAVTAGAARADERARAGANRAGVSRTPREEGTAASSGTTTLPHLPGIDLADALPRFNGDPAPLYALLRRFASANRDAANEVNALLARGDSAAALQLLHRVRGVAANLGARGLAVAALDFESAIRAADEEAYAARASAFATALAHVLDAAEVLSTSPSALDKATGTGHSDNVLAAASEHGSATAAPHVRDALAQLLVLLQNSNLKALAAFKAVQPQLAASVPREHAAALAEAIATLSFTQAAALVQDILDRKDTA